jgi:hypothetical protein
MVNNESDSEVRRCGPIDVLTRYFPGTSFRIAGDSTEIRTECLPNTGQEPYRQTNLRVALSNPN